MSHPDLPKRLFKYQSFTPCSIDNLRNRAIWCSPVSQFNDPFDCIARCELADEASPEDWREYLKEAEPRLEAKCSELGVVYSREEFIEALMKDGNRDNVLAVREAEALALATLRNQLGVACFTTKMDDMLMWAYYADGHHGFCLEFDTSYPPFDKAFPVEYSDSLPTMDPVRVIARTDADAVTRVLCRKSKAWRHEEEWRCFFAESGTAYCVENDALVGVYFGCEMAEDQKDEIGGILRGQGARTALFQMVKSDSEFRVIPEQVES